MRKKSKVGRPQKGLERTVFTVRLPTDLHRQLKHLAIDANVSITDIVTLLISEYLASNPVPDHLRESVTRMLCQIHPTGKIP